MSIPRTVTFFALLGIFGLITGTIGQESSTGARQAGDELVYVQYKENSSPQPGVLSNVTVSFSYDGGAAVSLLTFVEFYRQSDVNSHTFVFQRGGAGVGVNYADFEYTAVDATYMRVQANFYGIRT